MVNFGFNPRPMVSMVCLRVKSLTNRNLVVRMDRGHFPLSLL